MMMDSSNLLGMDSEISDTLRHLLENPSLLQPPEGEKKENENKQKAGCSKGKSKDQEWDYPSAYLGPQIWDDMLLSDDLKLEPVNIDELLDFGAYEECDDFGIMLEGITSPKMASPAEAKPPQSTLSYSDMPALMSAPSPESQQVPSPSMFLEPSQATINTNTSQNQQLSSHIQQQKQHHQLLQQQQPQQRPKPKQLQQQQVLHSLPHPSIPGHGLFSQYQNRQAFCQQQAMVLADIMANASNNNNSSSNENQVIVSLPNPISPQQQVQPNDHITTLSRPTSVEPLFTHFEIPTIEQPQSFVVPRSPQNYTNQAPSQNLTTPLPIQVRIPSPVKVDYEVNQADLVISSPIDDTGNIPHFDPKNRSFTLEELKPQPIVRKSHKVHIPPEGKDEKYWTRRNKNNVAAKRSREARRIKENQISLRAGYLEQENVSLKSEVQSLRRELLRIMKLLEGYEKGSQQPITTSSMVTSPQPLDSSM